MNNNNQTVSLYVHIPFCTSKCLYCAFYSEPVKDRDTTPLVNALITEMDLYPLTDNVKTVYIGGGTPTALGKDNLLKLVTEITTRCRNVKEFTIEANPRQLSDSLLNALRQSGANRLSIGAQSFDDNQLALLGRTHSAEDITTAVTIAKSAGFDNISIDLIFAIPDSTIDSWQKTIASAIALDVQHISAYALTWEPDTPLDAARKSGKLTPVDEETDRKMYDLAIETFARADYAQYEISNFARKGFQCLHNLTYWSNDPFIGIGPAAASYYDGTRTMNTADTDSYIKKIQNQKSPVTESETPDALQTACQTAVLNLRRTKGIEIADFKSKTGHDPTQLFAKEIKQNVEQGLLEIKQNQIRLTKQAYPIADKICADFSTL